MHIYVHTYNVHVWIQSYIHIHTCVCMCTYTYIHIQVAAAVNGKALIHAHIRTHIQRTCLDIHTHTFRPSRLSMAEAAIHAYIHIYNTHVPVQMHTYTHIQAFSIVNGGSGYSTPPNATIAYRTFTLTATCAPSSTTMLVSGAALAGISAGASIVVNNEVMMVTTVSGDALTLTVVRGREGTSPRTHGVGDRGRWLRNVMEGSISQVCCCVSD
jgi:hypothetical protein